MVSGESHYFQGSVIEEGDTPRLSLRGKASILLTVRPDTTPENRHYGQRLGHQAHENKMGTCNIEARRIWLNLELAKKPVQCLEYILVHELTHLLERNHNERFTGLLNQHLPQWRTLREELNGSVLAEF